MEGLFAFEGGGLGFVELLDGGGGEFEHLLELFGGEGGVFAGALDFDEGAVGEHGDVHVDVCFNVFDVVEICDGGSVDDADGDGGDLVGEDPPTGLAGLVFGEEFGFLGGGDGVGDGDVGSGDGGGTSATVGLEDVAVDEEGEAVAVGVLVGFEFYDGAECAADEALDFDGAAVGFGGVAAFTLWGGGGEHGVFGGEPAAAAGAFGFKPGGEVFFDHGGAEDLGFAEGDEDGASGVFGEVALDFEGAELGGGAVVVAGGGHEGLRYVFGK